MSAVRGMGDYTSEASSAFWTCQFVSGTKISVSALYVCVCVGLGL